MHGMGGPLRNSAGTSNQSLSQYLAPEGPLPRRVWLSASKQIEIEVIKIEQVKQFSSRRWHLTTVPDQATCHGSSRQGCALTSNNG